MLKCRCECVCVCVCVCDGERVCHRRCKLASKCGNVQTFSFAGFTRWFYQRWYKGSTFLLNGLYIYMYMMRVLIHMHLLMGEFDCPEVTRCSWQDGNIQWLGTIFFANFTCLPYRVLAALHCAFCMLLIGFDYANKQVCCNQLSLFLVRLCTLFLNWAAWLQQVCCTYAVAVFFYFGTAGGWQTLCLSLSKLREMC